MMAAQEPTLYIVPYFDEDFDLKVMEALHQRGHEAHCARDEGMIATSDAEQLAYAVRHDWTLVTFNRGDFARLHKQYLTNGWEHAGIVLSPQRETGRVLRALLNLLDRISADEARNQLSYRTHLDFWLVSKF